jgi:predicted MFS family arabinose efflux permease
LDDLVRTTADDTGFRPGALIWLAVATFSMGIDGYVLAGLLPRSRPTSTWTRRRPAAHERVRGDRRDRRPVLGALTGRWERKSTIVLALSVFVLGNLMVGLAPPTSGR